MTSVIEAVDAVIREARTLLGSGQGAVPSAPSQPGAPATAQGWNGQAAGAAETTSTRLHGLRGKLTDAHTAAITAMSVGPDIARNAHNGLDTIETGWQTDKEQLGPFAGTPEGKVALALAGQGRIAETQSLVFDIATQYGDAAANVNDATANLPETEQHTAETDPTNPDHKHPKDGSDPLTDQSEDLEGDHTDDLLAGTRSPAANPLFSQAKMAAEPAGAPTQPMMPPGMPMSMPTGGMPTGGGMPSGAGLSSLLQPLTQAATSAASAADSAPQGDVDDTDQPDHDASTGARVVKNADRALGLPYIWGGGGAGGPTGGGFDCSGLTQFAVAQATDGRVLLPRTTYEQIHVGERIDPSSARAGDLIFSNFSSPGVPEHVQIYAGDGKVIEAQQSGVPVKYSNAPTGSIVVKRVV
ncbi:glycoside hydrolase [Mycobacterium avium]|uniref:Glycoside hydrolase n=1 Tax=Mycobacterium avium TaxID=1764 RepID=A0A2A2ZB59_MYCAV|nr:C40 family peptidase [Mycobacterium avium]PBA23633.1 glycoside hydrolase [Mycobacterium avium]